MEVLGTIGASIPIDPKTERDILSFKLFDRFLANVLEEETSLEISPIERRTLFRISMRLLTV